MVQLCKNSLDSISTTIKSSSNPVQNCLTLSQHVNKRISTYKVLKMKRARICACATFLSRHRGKCQNNKYLHPTEDCLAIPMSGDIRSCDGSLAVLHNATLVNWIFIGFICEMSFTLSIISLSSRLDLLQQSNLSTFSVNLIIRSHSRG